MNMKTDIEIVTGFLGAGKTSFINSLLENTVVRGEKVLIIQCESGEQRITHLKYHNSKVIIRELDASRSLNTAYFKQMIEFYSPHRIIVEYNGTKLLGEVLSILQEDSLEGHLMEPVIYYVADAATFEMFFYNMKELIEPCVYLSNLILLNNCSLISEQTKRNLTKQLETLNQNAFVIPIKNAAELSITLKKSAVLDGGLMKRLRINTQNLMSRKLVRRR